MQMGQCFTARRLGATRAPSVPRVLCAGPQGAGGQARQECDDGGTATQAGHRLTTAILTFGSHVQKRGEQRHDARSDPQRPLDPTPSHRAPYILHPPLAPQREPPCAASAEREPLNTQNSEDASGRDHADHGHRSGLHARRNRCHRHQSE